MRYGTAVTHTSVYCTHAGSFLGLQYTLACCLPIGDDQTYECSDDGNMAQNRRLRLSLEVEITRPFPPLLPPLSLHPPLPFTPSPSRFSKIRPCSLIELWHPHPPARAQPKQSVPHQSSQGGEVKPRLVVSDPHLFLLLNVVSLPGDSQPWIS